MTTKPPPPDKLTCSGARDTQFGATACITTRAGVYNCSCGGAAYIGAFDDTSDIHKPALVFYDALGSGNEKCVAEAISHEVGHDPGLLHDGTSSTGCYEGRGSGTTVWAPIMGVRYSRNLVQWSNDEYSGANPSQDDYVAMGLTRTKTQARATAAVKVVDGNDNVVPGATVAGRWSGLTPGTASVVTGSNGIATFASANSKAKSGTFTFAVTGVALSGYAYDSTLNIETTDSIGY